MLTAWNMSEPHKWISYGELPVAERILLLTTLLLTVLVDLTVAISVGVAFGLAVRLKNRKPIADQWTAPDP